MTRPHQIRKIQSPPRAKGFIPLGFYRDRSDPVVLNIEEFESIRLLDYEGLTQEAAAKCMQVSRPTLTRIYERARGKVASALTEARQILIEGGNVVFKGNWYECDQCGSHFNNPLEELIASCPLCSSNRIQHLTDQKEEQKRERKDNRAGAMKMAIPLNGEKSTDKIAPYFARCSHFALVDPETCRAEIISNPYQDLSRVQASGYSIIFLKNTMFGVSLLSNWGIIFSNGPWKRECN